MGSCKPIRMHGEHYRIELFEGCNFSGQCVDICDDCPFLQSRGFSKNCINSVKVYGDGAWVMYEEPNFRGRMYIVERGDYCSHNEWQAQNPNIQSIRRVCLVTSSFTCVRSREGQVGLGSTSNKDREEDRERSFNRGCAEGVKVSVVRRSCVTGLPLRPEKMNDLVEEEDRAESPGSICPSMKSDCSKERPPDFSNEPGPSDTSYWHKHLDFYSPTKDAGAHRLGELGSSLLYSGVGMTTCCDNSVI
ncbi:gamma-crystallin N, partial [Lates japonicus]